MAALTKRQQVAIHESAHATVAWMLGLGVHRVEAGNGSGRATTDFYDSGDLEHVLEALVVLVAAGEVERYIERTKGFGMSVQGSDCGDLEIARALAAEVSTTAEEAAALLQLAEARARTMIRSPDFSERFAPLAEALFDQGELTGPALEDLLRGREEDGESEANDDED
jgi:hypothetical protein